MRTATLLLLGLGALAARAPQAHAQEALPRPFVLFVDGVNPEVVTSNGTLATDPSDATNTVLAFTGGAYAHPGLNFVPATGRSLAAHQAARDTMFFRLRVGPGVGTPDVHANLLLALLDSESNNSNGMSDDDDIGFRLIWPVPDSLFDDQWHDVAIPLPPVGRAALAAAMGDTTATGQPLPANEQLGPYGKRWAYPGGWNADGSAWVSDSGDGRFREFDFERIWKFGFMWDQGSGPTGTIYLDDWYVGNSGLDLSGYKGGGVAYSGTVTATQQDENTIHLSFTPQENVRGYIVYVVEAEGVSVRDAARAQPIATIPATASLFETDYKVFSPHPSMPDVSVTFAVTALSTGGVENTTPVYSTITVENARPQGFVYAMSEAEMDALYTAFETQTFNADFVPTGRVTPFRIDPAHGTIEKTEQVTSDADLSVTTYIGYGPALDDPTETVMMVYADINDDVTVFGIDNGAGEPAAGDFYTYDELAVYFTGYTVSPLVGSTNASETAQDFGFNFQILNGDDGKPKMVWPSGARSALFSTPLFEIKPDGSGYRILAAFLVSDLAPDGGPAVEFTRPADDAIDYHALVIAYDEQDGAGGSFTDRTGTVSSEKPNVNFSGPGWYDSPLQWTPVAFAGANVTTAAENTPAAARFALRGSVPNPASAQARIAFTTETSGPVRLDVFDVLGRRVATLVDATLPAGDHTATLDAARLAAGTYLYRLTASGRTATQAVSIVR